MPPRTSTTALLLSLTASLLTSTTLAQSSTASCGPSPSGSVRPAAAPGYSWQLVSSGLSDPRGITFDSSGRLLVVERGAGRVAGITYRDDGDCIVEQSRDYITARGPALNHGIEVDREGGILYASTTDEVLAWQYNAEQGTISGGDPQTIVQGMGGTDHSTRTLLLTRKEGQTGWLVVGFGSLSNLDEAATSVDNGPSTVKAFELNRSSNADAFVYPSSGTLLGWGLRNEVGLTEHPNSGGLWGVENSADQLSRHGVDIHAHNPGEELNFLGYLNGTNTLEQGTNFGYPWCFSAWDVSDLPENDNLTVGTQFAIDESSALGGQNRTDQYCAEQTRSRLVFESHMAPLDIKFNDTGKQAWISFHGSWNSPDPVGYKLSLVDFNENGEPVDDETSTTAAKDVFFNEDISRCNENCFRPVALAFDSQGRIFMSSDSTGEIYMIKKVEGGNGGPTASGAPPGSTSSQTSSGSQPTESGNGCEGKSAGLKYWMAAVPAAVAMLV